MRNKIYMMMVWGRDDAGRSVRTWRIFDSGKLVCICFSKDDASRVLEALNSKD